MNFIYYIVKKENMQIMEGRQDFATAYNIAQELPFPCVIFQGCFLTECPGHTESAPAEQEDETV